MLKAAGIEDLKAFDWVEAPEKKRFERALELLRRIGTSKEKVGDRQLLEDLDDVMTSTSLCALGGLAMMPIRSTMQKWPASFGGGLNE